MYGLFRWYYHPVKTFEEHIENLRQVFERLKSANLKMNLKKCCILQKQVSFLGHVVSENGISTDPSKLESIKNWPVPKLLKISEVSYGYVHTIESLSQNLQILQDLSINSQSLKQNFSGLVTANKPLINWNEPSLALPSFLTQTMKDYSSLIPMPPIAA